MVRPYQSKGFLAPPVTVDDSAVFEDDVEGGRDSGVGGSVIAVVDLSGEEEGEEVGPERIGRERRLGRRGSAGRGRGRRRRRETTVEKQGGTRQGAVQESSFVFEEKISSIY